MMKMNKDGFESCFTGTIEKFEYFRTNDALLLQGDSLNILNLFKKESVDLIFADPPYFLSNGGISCSGGKQVVNFKGSWDKEMNCIEKHVFNRIWLSKCKDALKPNGSIWVSGTMHNIYSIGFALEQEGFKIINNITWQKLNPPPNLACRCFTHSTETILWAKKLGAKHVFHYNTMKEENHGKQMKDVWTGSLTSQKEKTFGKHPTQKPLYLLDRIIRCSSNENDIVLDPFCGSGTTGVACLPLQRKFIGIDLTEEYLALAKKRITNCK